MSSAVVVTEVEICNIALGLLGSSRIQSLDENSGPAIECKARFDLSLNHVLHQHPWQFMTSFAQLAVVNETPVPPWTYVYQQPSDSTLVHRVFDVNGLDVGYKTYGDRILCDEPSVWAQYSKKVTVAALPPYVAQIVATHLAYVLAAKLGHSGVANRNALYELYTDELRKARFISAKESGPIPCAHVDWMVARNSTTASLLPRQDSNGPA